MKNDFNSWGLTPAELRKLRSLKTPHGIQRLLDDMPYHLADSAWSPRRVLREKYITADIGLTGANSSEFDTDRVQTPYPVIDLMAEQGLIRKERQGRAVLLEASFAGVSLLKACREDFRAIQMQLSNPMSVELRAVA